jgi:hypothetical protein
MSSCPGGYGNPTTLEQFTEPPSNTCTCNCTGVGDSPKNPCTQGTTGSVTFGYMTAQCGGTNMTKTIPLTIPDGTCSPLGQQIGQAGQGPFTAGKMTPAAPAQIACANPQPPTAPPLQTIMGRTCTPSQTGSACSGGGTCLTAAPNGQQCIQVGTDLPCPSPFVTKYTVYAPGDVPDMRACDGCTCTSAATLCTNATLSTHSNQNCTDPATNLTANGSCNALSSNGDSNDSYFIYNATPDTMTCKPTSATVPAANPLTLPTKPTTVCCM